MNAAVHFKSLGGSFGGLWQTLVCYPSGYLIDDRQVEADQIEIIGYDKRTAEMGSER